MSSLLDVQNALASLVGSTVYPLGESQPSIINKDVAVYPGWPTPSDLDASALEGRAIISVDEMPNMQRNVSKLPRVWQTISINDPTITATVYGQVITLGGFVSVPQTVMVIVDKVSHVYAVKTTDDIYEVIKSLGVIIPGSTVLSETEISIFGAKSITVRIGVAGLSGMEVMRLETVFMITVWASTPIERNTLSEAIKLVFAEVDFLPLPDNFPARMICMGSKPINSTQKAGVYQHCLTYRLECPTVKLETNYTITYPFVNSLTVNP